MGDSKDRRLHIHSVVLLAFSIIYSAFVLLRMIGASGSFEQMFLELNVKLPLLTRIVLSPAFTWTIALLALANVVKEYLVKDKKATLIANAAYLAVVLVVHQVCVTALFLPLLRLMEDLQ